jgi:small subunit ribosomal protein S20
VPISKSAKKSLRSSETKAKRNLVLKAKLKTAIKKTTSENLSSVYSTIDKSAKRGLIHKNKAARLKSKLAKSVKDGAAPKVVKKQSKPKTTKKLSRKTAAKKTVTKKK